MARSVGALFIGFVVVVALTLATDAALHASGIFPPVGQAMSDALFGLATVYRTVYGAFGSYLTARFAPNRPLRHAMIGGAIGLVLSIVGAVTTWNNGPAFGPHWYPLALVALALPQSWLGGMLYVRQAAGRMKE